MASYVRRPTIALSGATQHAPRAETRPLERGVGRGPMHVANTFANLATGSCIHEYGATAADVGADVTGNVEIARATDIGATARAAIESHQHVLGQQTIDQ